MFLRHFESPITNIRMQNLVGQGHLSSILTGTYLDKGIGRKVYRCNLQR